MTTSRRRRCRTYAWQRERMMATYPSLFATEMDVVCHLFFTNGNGYRWHDGGLVYHLDRLSLAEAVRRAQADARAMYARMSSADHSEWMQAWARAEIDVIDQPPGRQREIEIERRRKVIAEHPFDPSNRDTTWFVLADGTVGCRIYPLCEYAKIATIPDDVRPDWLDAADRAVEMGRLMHPSAEDTRWLDRARARIQHLRGTEARHRHAPR